ncbi:hypothetical protein P7M41_22035 [Vibrio parahaemolyticus]|uniref:hypothetical protein n=1 Tax=Vibrio parahaemolyticus TaxID=670 RepID=UPI00068E67BA|nr:hypothetical protein [Vibrio parahaemolyticus]HBC3534067.1 hypothetical protein [Vibrio vulnificus]MDF4259052.1 hypothetical protein [Vibrio parahaemolyticus]MDF4264245.1 hypothetical protein [Vibrio parahaemolyticus]MDF4326130.1 hypothetical protein [Vibrio parahaemolyticus]MDG2554711.1 hypothetical protein [Vibrio parahaemolyticus]
MDLKTLQPTNKSALWQLQLELLKEAELRFGQRDSSKTIYQPSWDPDGPHIRYTPTKDGAFAELGYNAKSSWRLTVYQLAHETVHLLDQHGGERAIFLEEGAAVRFSLDMMIMYGFDTTGLPSISSYQMALALFDGLGTDAYQVTKNARLKAGSFNGIDAANLQAERQDLSMETIARLLSKPVMR